MTNKIVITAVSAILAIVICICVLEYQKGRIDPKEFQAPSWGNSEAKTEITLLHKNGKRVTYDLNEFTQRHATESWNDCLYAFWIDLEWIDGKAWRFQDSNEPNVPWLIDAPDEVNSIRRKGWEACTIRLLKLCRSYSEPVVRHSLNERFKRAGSDDKEP